MAKTRRRNGFFTLLILGVIFTGVGGCILYFLGHNIELTLVRSESPMPSTIVRTSILGESETVESFGLNTVHQAIIQENRDSDGDKTYRVALETEDGPIPLASYYSSGRGGHQKKVDTINQFLSGNEHEPVLHIEQSAFLIRLAGFVFAGIGILLLLSAVRALLKLILALILLTTKS